MKSNNNKANASESIHPNFDHVFALDVCSFAKAKDFTSPSRSALQATTAALSLT